MNKQGVDRIMYIFIHTCCVHSTVQRCRNKHSSKTRFSLYEKLKNEEILAGVIKLKFCQVNTTRSADILPKGSKFSDKFS